MSKLINVMKRVASGKKTMSFAYGGGHRKINRFTKYVLSITPRPRHSYNLDLTEYLFMYAAI